MQSAHFSPLRSFLRNNHQCYRLCAQAYTCTTRPFSACVGRGPVAYRLVQSDLRPVQNLVASAALRLREFSTPPQATQSSTTLADPSRPSLFYHFLPAPNPISAHFPAFAVSLLKRPSKDAQSPAVMGWLPAAANDRGGEAGLGDFRENGTFLEVMHQVIKKAIEDGTDERLKAEAVQLGEGWMHINDDRSVPAIGRINNPDDIIASVRVEASEILPETYSPMPAYRTCTADGLTTLSEGLERRLLEELQRRESE